MIFEEPPKRIYLQYHGDSDPEEGPVNSDDVTWCCERIFDSDIEYQLVKEAES